MDMKFGAKEEGLRQEVKNFLDSQLGKKEGPGSWGERGEEDFQKAVSFNQELGKRGWIAPAWPKEYGGLGASIYEQMVFNEEFGYCGAPDTGTRGFGVGMIGPTLIVHGTDEQKKQATSRRSPAARTSGARATASRAPAPTSPPSRRAPSATATTTSSTARRSGPPAPTAPTRCSASSAPTPTPPSTAASPSC